MKQSTAIALSFLVSAIVALGVTTKFDAPEYKDVMLAESKVSNTKNDNVLRPSVLTLEGYPADQLAKSRNAEVSPSTAATLPLMTDDAATTVGDQVPQLPPLPPRLDETPVLVPPLTDYSPKPTEIAVGDLKYVRVTTVLSHESSQKVVRAVIEDGRLKGAVLVGFAPPDIQGPDGRLTTQVEFKHLAYKRISYDVHAVGMFDIAEIDAHKNKPTDTKGKLTEIMFLQKMDIKKGY